MYDAAMALISAIIWAVFGYLMNKEEEDFELEKLVSTFLAALFVALLSTTWSIPVEVGDQFFGIFLVRTGLVVFIERILKTLWKRFGAPLFNWVDK